MPEVVPSRGCYAQRPRLSREQPKDQNKFAPQPFVGLTVWADLVPQINIEVPARLRVALFTPYSSFCLLVVLVVDEFGVRIRYILNVFSDDVTLRILVAAVAVRRAGTPGLPHIRNLMQLVAGLSSGFNKRTRCLWSKGFVFLYNILVELEIWRTRFQATRLIPHPLRISPARTRCA